MHQRLRVNRRDLFFAATGQGWLCNKEAEERLRHLAREAGEGTIELSDADQVLFEEGTKRNQKASDTHWDWINR